MSEKSYGRHLKGLGFESKQNTTNKVRGWLGIRLRTDEDEDVNENEDIKDNNGCTFVRLNSNLQECLVTDNWVKSGEVRASSGYTYEKVSKTNVPNVQTYRNASQTNILTPTLKKYATQYLENPKVKPDNVDFIEWLVKSVFDETGIDVIRIKTAIIDLPKDDSNFSEKAEPC